MAQRESSIAVQQNNPTHPATIVALLDDVVSSALPDLLSYKKDGAWHSLSAQELAAQVRATTLGLYSLGVRPGDHIGLLSENRPEWTVADLGVLNCACADVPIYATQAPNQVSYILNDAKVEVMFISSAQQMTRLRAALEDVPGLKKIIAFDHVETDDPRVIYFADVQAFGRQLDRLQPDLYERLRRQAMPESLATLIYTSGTTGEPKGVMLTHDNIMSNVRSVAQAMNIQSGDVALSFLPFSHIFERVTIYLDLFMRVRIYLAESIDTVAQNLTEVRPHFMTSVPRLYEKIYAKTLEKAEAAGAAKARIANWAIEVAKEWAILENSGQSVPLLLQAKRAFAIKLVFSKWQAAFGGRIKNLASGGAALPLELAQVFYGAGLSILQGYGLTESSPVITMNTAKDNRLGSCGKAIPGVKVKIAEEGEILASGPNIMQGYFNKPTATAEALSRDKEGNVWLHTGDIGHLDADGYLYITDRKKDLLKTSGGKYIAPQPIENALKQSRFINQAVVIGDERKFPAALIVPHFDALKSYAELKGISYQDVSELLRHPRIIDLIERQIDKLTPEVSKFEKIKGVVLLDREMTIESGELTPTLKVKRRVVMEKYKDQIDAMYAEKERQHQK
ncbi:MAG TPA: long-chain fatty acid--CoA ligase [Blastocatellia bacterium]|nr:long-chain fatty acid--CoA ligase [Blastocatellia bacterium]